MWVLGWSIQIYTPKIPRYCRASTEWSGTMTWYEQTPNSRSARNRHTSSTGDFVTSQASSRRYDWKGTFCVGVTVDLSGTYQEFLPCFWFKESPTSLLSAFPPSLLFVDNQWSLLTSVVESSYVCQLAVWSVQLLSNETFYCFSYKCLRMSYWDCKYQ